MDQVMTPTPISDVIILLFGRFFMLNVPANLTFFKREWVLQNSIFVL